MFNNSLRNLEGPFQRPPNFLCCTNSVYVYAFHYKLKKRAELVHLRSDNFR